VKSDLSPEKCHKESANSREDGSTWPHKRSEETTNYCSDKCWQDSFTETNLSDQKRVSKQSGNGSKQTAVKQADRNYRGIPVTKVFGAGGPASAYECAEN
jgi:hypothetical protein